MKKEDRKILIVEDEVSMLNVLREKLTHEGFRVLVAKNGQEGLEVTFRERPDLILLDLVMPVMDGMSVLHKLRADTWGKEVKVIVLTNLADNEKAAEALALGACDYIVKSDWKIDDVVTKIRERLKK